MDWEEIWVQQPALSFIASNDSRILAVTNRLQTLVQTDMIGSLVTDVFCREDHSGARRRLLRRTGRPLAINLELQPFKTFQIGHVSVIDEHAEGLNRLREKIIDALPQALHGMSTDQSCSIFSSAGHKLLKAFNPTFIPTDETPLESLAAWRVFDEHFETEVPVEQFPVRRALRGESHSKIYGIILPDGVKKLLHFNAVPLLNDGFAISEEPVPAERIFGACVHFTDMTEEITKARKEASEKTALVKARTNAEEANKLKTQFLSNVSHEIRTPLAAAKGLHDLLSSETDCSLRQREMLDQMKGQLDILQDLVNDVLDLNKVESGRFSLDLAPFSLTGLMNDLIQTTTFTNLESSAQFEHDVQIPLDCDVCIGDRGRIRQILANLLSNAMKFGQNGVVRFEVSARLTTTHNVFLNATIQDHGIGITQEQLKRLWQPFAQAESSTTRLFGGSGLGLTISRALSSEMAGSVSLESKGENQGSLATFQVCLAISTQPVNDSARADSGFTPLPLQANLKPAPRPVNGRTSSQLRKSITILVVEDNHVLRKITVSQLNKLGFSVIAAENGQVAVTKVLEQPVDLIVMDLMMPVMDGFEATSRIRESFSAEQLPIIALTASAIRGDDQKSYAYDMQAHVTKPVDLQLLENIILRCLHIEKV